MKVRALSTIHGSYGLINEGEEKSIAKHFAEDLEKAGLVEILDKPAPTEEGQEPTTEIVETPAEVIPQGKDMTNVRKGKTDGK